MKEREITYKQFKEIVKRWFSDALPETKEEEKDAKDKG